MYFHALIIVIMIKKVLVIEILFGGNHNDTPLSMSHLLEFFLIGVLEFNEPIFFT